MTSNETTKYKDTALAEKLFPEYKRSRSLAGVHAWAKQEGINISLPTLRKMAEYHGWKKLLQEEAQGKMAIAGDTLEDLLGEVTQKKNDIARSLQASPDDKDLHILFGKYIGQILDIKKQIAQRDGAARLSKVGLFPEFLGVFIEFAKESQDAVLLERLQSVGGDFAEYVKAKYIE